MLSTTQGGARAVVLGLNGHSALDAWASASRLLRFVPERPVPGLAPVAFNGGKASDLNALLASGPSAIVVTSAALQIDQPLELRRNGVTLDLGHAVLASAGAGPYLLRVEGASSIAIKGGIWISGQAGILVNQCRDVRVERVEIRNLSSHGIVVTGSDHVVIARNRIYGVSGAPILLHLGTTNSVVQHNDIADNLGPSNVTAGIVVSDREVDLTSNPSAIFGPDGYWVVSQPIGTRLHPPHDNAIANNQIVRNASSGIYVDGGVRNAILSNIIESNAKEGLCLDNGSAANIVSSNVVELNGDRWGEPDWVLQEDSVLAGGRLADGTAAEKTPGISLDNAFYNVVFGNNVAHNFGGGVKIVRTGYFNLIGMNTLYSDNDGVSATFHFFGVELGATPGDGTSDELDFTPSQGNIVFSNPIRGTHYSGIFFDAGSDQNDVFDNTILDATDWALESVAVMANNSLNNLTNLPSRNIGSGIDPALLVIGQPVVDPGQ